VQQEKVLQEIQEAGQEALQGLPGPEKVMRPAYIMPARRRP
jgi:hypothetical protein